MICESCGKDRVIAARGLCRTCYSRWQRGGTVAYIRPLKDRTCSVEGCTNRVHGQGLCNKHLLRLRRTGTTDEGRQYTHIQRKPDSLRTTHDLYPVWAEFVRRKNPRPVVETWKDFDTFIAQVTPRPGRRFRIYGRDRSLPLGPDNYEWKEAAVEKLPGEDRAAYAKRQREAHRAMYPGAYKDSNLRKSFGEDFGLERFDAMHQSQNGKCAMCGSAEVAKTRTGEARMLCVDHDHRTGQVRALLCSACNTILGAAQDDVRILQAAIAYLERHNAQPGETRFTLDATTERG